MYNEEQKYFDYREKLPQIKAKTLVVVGSEDWICPVQHSEYIAAKIPGAELCVVKEANHSVHLEKNAEVLTRIRSHLST